MKYFKNKLKPIHSLRKFPWILIEAKENSLEMSLDQIIVFEDFPGRLEDELHLP